MKQILLGCMLVFIVGSCHNNPPAEEVKSEAEAVTSLLQEKTSLVILGTVQDAGSPHIGCSKDCCADLFDNPDISRKVVSLGLFDAQTGKKYLFEATPDMPEQMKILKRFGKESGSEIADAIFITHAHIGHYTGLMYLGKEAINSKNVPLYVMPGMYSFIIDNAPWNLLARNGNIDLLKLEEDTTVNLSENLSVTPFLVPHRDELSETVGFRITGPNKKVLFIPDIDKWDQWEKSIVEEIRRVDYAIIDATFFSGEEINRRDISQIPHPFVIESMAIFGELSVDERKKVLFIHFNHTNPLLDINSKEAELVLKEGYRIARMNDILEL